MSALSGALTGQVAIVTGAAAGIGRAVALALAAEGASLALIDLDAGGLEATQALVQAQGATALSQPLDIAKGELIAPAIAAVLQAFGRIDILVNCAGITGPTTKLLEVDPAVWDHVFAVNIKAPFLFIQHAAAAMVTQGAGRIVNITSSSAHRARWSIPAYGASKAALSQLTRSAAAELGPHNINVNAVAPGLTATRMVAGFTPEALADALRESPVANLLHRLSDPEDIAATVLFLCLPASRQITGQTLHVSAGAVV